jgi:hypothetical protein
MRQTILLLFCILPAILFAQPGYYSVAKNLNDFSNEEIRKSRKSPQLYRYTFKIDSTTQLERLKLLSHFQSLSIVLDMEKFPREFGMYRFKNLVGLNLTCTDKVKSLDGVESLTSLKSLDIKDYQGHFLPSGLYMLHQLERLIIRAPNLEHIDVLGRMVNLQTLQITQSNIWYFPLFEQGNQLKSLYLRLDSNFREYQHIRSLRHLEHLSLAGGQMRAFPMDFSQYLISLGITEMPYLEDVSGIRNYPLLKRISISQTGIKQFANNFYFFEHLEYLNISYNNHLSDVSGLQYLRRINKLELSALPALERIEGDWTYCSFKSVKFYNMPKLKHIDAILSCDSMDRLFIEKTGIETLPSDLFKCKNLQFLRLSHNIRLKDVSGVSHMPRLKRLSIYECDSLQTVPTTLSTNDSLQHVMLEFGDQLVSAPGLSGLKQLEHLRLRALNDNFRLPANLNTSNKLSQIIIETRMKDISMIHHLPELKHFRIMYSLHKLPKSFYTNTNLQILEIYQSSISDLSQLTRFSQLTQLRLKHNPRLRKIPDLAAFVNLQKVDIGNNKSLKIKKEYPYKSGWRIK